MATKKMTEAEIRDNLAMTLPGDVVEELLDLADDPSAFHAPGPLMRSSLALIALGELCGGAAKGAVAMHIEGATGVQGTFEDSGVVFKNVEAVVTKTLDRDKVAAELNFVKLDYANAPHLFKEGQRRGYIKVELVRD